MYIQFSNLVTSSKEKLEISFNLIFNFRVLLWDYLSKGIFFKRNSFHLRYFWVYPGVAKTRNISVKKLLSMFVKGKRSRVTIDKDHGSQLYCSCATLSLGNHRTFSELLNVFSR